MDMALNLTTSPRNCSTYDAPYRPIESSVRACLHAIFCVFLMPLYVVLIYVGLERKSIDGYLHPLIVLGMCDDSWSSRSY